MTYTAQDADLVLLGQHPVIVGMDEVGRGCIAGPIVACAVCLGKDEYHALRDLQVADSKALKATERATIVRAAIQVVTPVFAQRSASDIDSLGIQACNRAIFIELQAAFPGALYLVDGNLKLPNTQSLIKGETISFAIALASVFAKEHRDAFMAGLDAVHGHYNFAQHKGYGTYKHCMALRKHGPLAGIHRQTFIASIAGQPSTETSKLAL